jgi:hypothetical protein
MLGPVMIRKVHSPVTVAQGPILTQHHRTLLQSETSSVRTNFSVSNEDLQDLRFSQCVVEDSGLQGCDIVLLSFLMFCRNMVLYVEQIYRSVGQHGLDNQGMVVFGGPAEGHA